MSNEQVLGIAIGVLVGYVEGINLNILFASASTWRDDQTKVLKALGQLLAIPGCVLGGPWLTGAVLVGTDMSAFASPYVVAMALVFVGFTYRAAHRLSDAAVSGWSAQPRRPHA